MGDKPNVRQSLDQRLTKIQNLKPNHFLPLVEMPRCLFDFYADIMNQAEPSFTAYTTQIRSECYMVSPYEVLANRESPWPLFPEVMFPEWDNRERFGNN